MEFVAIWLLFLAGLEILGAGIYLSREEGLMSLFCLVIAGVNIYAATVVL